MAEHRHEQQAAAAPLPASPTPAGSFGQPAVADAYDRSRPTYPREAASWLTGTTPAHVLELGAGTGRLTEQLRALRHDVLATDPAAAMLRHLARRLPDTPAVVAAAERIPTRARSADVVVAAQSFHFFDLGLALPEIARVLRPGGHLALVWNERDERVPWVRRLGALLGGQDSHGQVVDPTHELQSSHLFGYVEKATFRCWQHLDRPHLHDLVRSRSHVAVLPPGEQERLLAKVDELYADYGRGPDGMLLPYVTQCFKAVVRAPALVEDVGPRHGERHSDPGRGSGDDGDADALLIDFQ